MSGTDVTDFKGSLCTLPSGRLLSSFHQGYSLYPFGWPMWLRSVTPATLLPSHSLPKPQYLPRLFYLPLTDVVPRMEIGPKVCPGNLPCDSGFSSFNLFFHTASLYTSSSSLSLTILLTLPTKPLYSLLFFILLILLAPYFLTLSAFLFPAFLVPQAMRD